MAIFRLTCGGVRFALNPFAIRRPFHSSVRSFSSSLSPLPTTAVCPTCDCGPELSDESIEKKLEGNTIDRKTTLQGLVPRHRVHLTISTGRSDWESNFELEENTLARDVKALVGRGGRYNNPFWNVLVSNTSLPVDHHEKRKEDLPTYSSATIFPFGLHFPYIPHTPTAIENFVQGYLLEPDDELDVLRLSNAHASSFRHEVSSTFNVEPHEAAVVDQTPAIFICGHGKRDLRCGVIGPLLLDEFRKILSTRGSPSGEDNSRSSATSLKKAKMGLITHISGHKFAGNVVMFLSADHPISVAVNNSQGECASSGAGKNNMVGIWYGRVSPQHCAGIADETTKGHILEDLLRGIVAGDGRIIP